MRGACGCAVAVAALALWAPPAPAARCSNADAVKVPGAEQQKTACLDDLTTAGTSRSGHTDQSDWSGLTPRAQRNPSGVPGLQVDGYFPDTSRTNATHNWNHDAQFVIRLPDEWNGKLVITGAPGVRKQYAPDPVIGDHVLAAGYAYASTDKGNTGTGFYNDGAAPGDAVAEWHTRVTELALAAKRVVEQKYGRAARRTYVTGISNGGYLTRWQLENRPELYDGGVDWEGTLMLDEGPNLFTYLPVGLREFPRYRATNDRAAHERMIAAGFPPGSEFLWEDHYAVYWDLTQRVYREEFDPDFDGGLSAGLPFCQSGTPMCDADYDYGARGEPVHAAVRKTENTADIGKPMLTLHGTIDALLPIATDSDVYRRLIQARGKAAIHRYYVIENGNHVDGRYDTFPDRIKPIHPCWAAAFAALDAWVERGTAPPPDQFVPDRRPAGHDPANACTLAQGAAAAPGPLPAAGDQQVTRRRPRGIAVSARRRGARGVRVSGRLRLPPGVSARQACGDGTVELRIGRALRRARLGRRCTFAATLRRPRGRRATVRVRWLGNRALEPLTRSRRVRIG